VYGNSSFNPYEIDPHWHIYVCNGIGILKNIMHIAYRL